MFCPVTTASVMLHIWKLVTWDITDYDVSPPTSET